MNFGHPFDTDRANRWEPVEKSENKTDWASLGIGPSRWLSDKGRHSPDRCCQSLAWIDSFSGFSESRDQRLQKTALAPGIGPGSFSGNIFQNLQRWPTWILSKPGAASVQRWTWRSSSPTLSLRQGMNPVWVAVCCQLQKNEASPSYYLISHDFALFYMILPNYLVRIPNECKMSLKWVAGHVNFIEKMWERKVQRRWDSWYRFSGKGSKRYSRVCCGSFLAELLWEKPKQKTWYDVIIHQSRNPQIPSVQIFVDLEFYHGYQWLWTSPTGLDSLHQHHCPSNCDGRKLKRIRCPAVHGMAFSTFSWGNDWWRLNVHMIHSHWYILCQFSRH